MNDLLIYIFTPIIIAVLIVAVLLLIQRKEQQKNIILLSQFDNKTIIDQQKNKKNNRYLIIGIGYLILFFIVLTPDINNAVGRGIQALLFCILGYRCEENIRRFIKNRQ